MKSTSGAIVWPQVMRCKKYVHSVLLSLYVLSLYGYDSTLNMLICAPGQSKPLCSYSPFCRLLSASLHCFCLLDHKVPLVSQSWWVSPLFELGFLSHFSCFSLSEFMHLPGMVIRGRSVLLLCFFQVRTSVLSMSTVFMVRVPFPRNRRTKLLEGHVTEQVWSLWEIGFGGNDGEWGRCCRGGRKSWFFKIVISSSLWTVAEDVSIACELVVVLRTRIPYKPNRPRVKCSCRGQN